MKIATILTALATAASGYTILDAENFSTAIMDGYWLVKYYSPTCPWSRKFAPVWEKVYGDLEDKLAENDVFFAEVDCKANRAVCDAAIIDGYPTVVFYNQGVNKGEVPGGQSYEALRAFAQSI
ncbi:hypothetical protein GGH12_001376 [Coemansia sp. RSA 1822]|nr:hypothetical protein LPJ76_005061 [Coemansia sp. RSA 638]KAJ2123619.1 hypothetical protein IW147_002368 [Coemansia sp. RSA 720]KAJ2539739.1 hypothetical protein GGF49_004982 [Coemansia sp. RSA 1853]KAJ2565581.1 hypothetical protein GGH12_001376 [Coemansia sp. RSA 1822]